MFCFKPGVKFILASASPRRKQLLGELGISFDIVVPDCDETQLENESAEEMVERLACEKADKVAVQDPQAWVLGADTTVVIDGHVLGKPEDAADARRMLSTIQGRTHKVIGAFALRNIAGDRSVCEVRISEVTIAPLTRHQIEAYLSTGEPMDKAGSYAIQGIGAGLVQEVRGSYTNVVGLDICALIKALDNLGLLK